MPKSDAFCSDRSVELEQLNTVAEEKNMESSDTFVKSVDISAA